MVVHGINSLRDRPKTSRNKNSKQYYEEAQASAI